MDFTVILSDSKQSAWCYVLTGGIEVNELEHRDWEICIEINVLTAPLQGCRPINWYCNILQY